MHCDNSRFALIAAMPSGDIGSAGSDAVNSLPSRSLVSSWVPALRAVQFHAAAGLERQRGAAAVGEYLQPGEFYEISWRCLITPQVANLAVTGRCISVSFILEASMRIQPTCMSIGEAAGKAAIWAKEHHLAFNQIKWEDLPPSARSYVSKNIV